MLNPIYIGRFLEYNKQFENFSATWKIVAQFQRIQFYRVEHVCFQTLKKKICVDSGRLELILLYLLNV